MDDISAHRTAVNHFVEGCQFFNLESRQPKNGGCFSNRFIGKPAVVMLQFLHDINCRFATGDSVADTLFQFLFQSFRDHTPVLLNTLRQ